MTQKKNSQIFFLLGGTLTILGAFAHMFNVIYAPYVFSLGAAAIIYLQLMQALHSKDMSQRMQRLIRMGFFSSLLLGLAAYLMFVHSNSWVVAVLIYALTSIFYTFRGDN
jgi:hypothetical protein